MIISGIIVKNSFKSDVVLIIPVITLQEAQTGTAVKFQTESDLLGKQDNFHSSQFVAYVSAEAGELKWWR